MSIEEHIERENDYIWRLSRAVDNLRKLGEAKITYGQVKSRLNALNSSWNKFQENHEKISEIKFAAKGDQLDAIKKLSHLAKDYYGLCEEHFLSGEEVMLHLLESLKPAPAATVQAAAAPQDAPAGGSSKRLPRIELPTFAGSYSEWEPFYDLFSSMVRENSQLLEVEKLHYLKTSVTDEPLQLIKNISLTAENFPRAWETLVSRYENKRL
ncbi:uncharacterized protein LOC124307432 [Neodiprion virginianus]|uniref:uncharacterized protein LOC124307432 n=1 Tax=Neodiprion virginianus TaxID=2961670 RepID=UPI001EE6AE79|nr:uncharacterized protein LOC124307432 [Neodiprion virginianus]